MSEVYTQLFIL